MAAFGLMAAACGNLDNPLENIQGGGSSSAEDVITKYEFKVTDLSADNDITLDITVLKLTNEEVQTLPLLLTMLRRACTR